MAWTSVSMGDASDWDDGEAGDCLRGKSVWVQAARVNRISEGTRKAYLTSARLLSRRGIGRGSGKEEGDSQPRPVNGMVH